MRGGETQRQREKRRREEKRREEEKSKISLAQTGIRRSGPARKLQVAEWVSD